MLKKARDFKEATDYIIQNIDFLDDDDGTYIDDLKSILPKLFARELKSREKYERLRGTVNPADMLALLDLCYEGKGTLREYYPDWFKDVEKGK